MNPILNQQVQQLRAQIDEIVKDLHDLTTHVNNPELVETVSELRNRINEPFMFVIVGEVKAGKSSFINALLATGKEICKVGPQPVTDTIQQILYGEQEEEVVVNQYLRKLFHPVDILREIAIVDTPGTNTIIRQHQEITERFIPASDLIVFVFEAKNPYRQSAWEFFDFIHSDWRKKIIFVLQQKDLMDPEDLQVNIKGVTDHAKEKGLQEPRVFAVSAKDELQGNTGQSGFAEVREYVQENITGGQAPVLKLANNLTTSQNIHEKIKEGLELRRKQFELDKAFRQDVQETLEDQEMKSNHKLEQLISDLLNTYDRVSMEIRDELSSGLSFFSLLKRSLSALFSKKSSAKEWLEGLARELEEKMNKELNDRLYVGVADLADSIQQMAQIIDLKIKNSKTVLQPQHEIFSDIAQRRQLVLQELQQSFEHFLRQSESFKAREIFPEEQNLLPNVAAGGGIAVIGVILAVVTNTMVFDITGGVLTTVGLLFAGISSGIKRKKILSGYREAIDKGRELLRKEVQHKLSQYIRHVRERIDGHFGDFDLLMEEESDKLETLEQQHSAIELRMEALEKSIQSIS